MQALIYDKEKGLVLRDVSKPEMGREGAVIKVLSCSICGTDIRTKRFGSAKIDDGRIVGHEVTGRIIELSDDLRDTFAVGDNVAIAPAIGCGKCSSCRKGHTNMCDDLKTLGYQYDGGFAEYMTVPMQAFVMRNVYKLPDVPDISIYSLSEPLACAINAQSYLKITDDDNVVIFGSGIIGCMHAELALLSGAKKVIISEPDQRRIDQIAGMLPQVEFINSAKQDLLAEVKRLTDNHGADVAIIACSVGQAQKDGMELLAKCGRISLFGGLPGESTGFIDSNLIHYREISVFGVHASTAKQNMQAMKMVYEQKLDVSKYVTKRYLLEEIDQAFEDILTGGALKAIIVAKPET